MRQKYRSLDATNLSYAHNKTLNILVMIFLSRAVRPRAGAHSGGAIHMICALCIIGHRDASYDIPVISIVLATMHCRREDGMRCS